MRCWHFSTSFWHRDSPRVLSVHKLGTIFRSRWERHVWLAVQESKQEAHHRVQQSDSLVTCSGLWDLIHSMLDGRINPIFIKVFVKMLRWEKNLQRPVVRDSTQQWCLILHTASKLKFLLNTCHHCYPSRASLHHLHQPIPHLAVTRQHLHPGWLGPATLTSPFWRKCLTSWQKCVQLNGGKAQQGFIPEDQRMRCTFKWQKQNRM